MSCNKIRYSEHGNVKNQNVCFELDRTELSAQKVEQLEALVEQSGILEAETEHRGPAHGKHEISITVEATDGKHEAIVCDVGLASDQEPLVLFVKKEGHSLP